MSIEHIRAALTVTEMAPATAAYQDAQQGIFNARVKLADLPPDSSRHTAQASLLRALEAQAEAAHARAVAELVLQKAAAAVTSASAAAA